MANIRKMSGTPWHIEQIHRKKGSKNRKRIDGRYDPKKGGYITHKKDNYDAILADTKDYYANRASREPVSLGVWRKVYDPKTQEVYEEKTILINGKRKKMRRKLTKK